MALTDVSLIEFSAIPALDPLAPIGPGWLLLVQDNVSGAVWRATTVQAKAIIAPAVVVSTQTAPVVSLALSASTSQLGTLITLTAQASSTSSTIAKVDFFDSGVKVGSAASQPYQATYTPALSGRHTIVAVATDANGTATTSASQFLDISALVVAPVIVSLVPMAPGSVGTALSLVANASLAGGTIAKVEFFDGANKVGEAASSPYGCSYVPTTPGPHYFTAKATSSTGASAISAALTVQVVQPVTITNQPPSVSLSASITTLTIGQSVTLSALASDVDGNVVSVEFFDGATSIGRQTSPPYSVSYPPTTSGGHALTAKATDNLGAFSTAQVNVTVNSLAIAALAPTNVVAALIAPSGFTPSYSIGVAWLAPAPNGSMPISGYYIYRDGGPVPIGASATLAFTDPTVRASEVHYYTVAAFTGPGVLIGALSIATANLTVPAAAVNTVPGAPTMGTPIANATSISVYFTPSANTGGSVVNYYDVYRNNVKVGSTPSTYYPDSLNLVVGMQYVYTVIAVNAQGPSPFSNPSAGVYLTGAAATPITAPGAPTGVYGTASSNSVLVYFTAPTSNGGATITGFNVYRSGTLLLPMAAGTASSYQDNGAVNGQTYLYTVAAINSVGTGPQSTSATVVMTTAAVTATAPSAPTNAMATAGNATVSVTATAAAVPSGQPATTGFTIYRINTSTGVSTLLATNTPTLPYTDSGVTNGTAYTYTIAAVNSAGMSAAATTNPVTPVAPAAVVYNTTLTGPSSSPASGQPGAGITLTSGGADVLKFNNVTTGSSVPQRMNLSIGGTVVAAVDFPTSYIGTGFTYTPASGTLHSGTFANGTVII